MNDSLYRSTGTVLLRSTRVPIATPVPDPPDSPDTGAWMTWLAQAWQVDLLPDAVQDASPDLARAVRALLAAPQPTEPVVRRVCAAVLRYLLRFRYRSTPFGLFTRTIPAVIAGNICTVPTPSDQVCVRADAVTVNKAVQQAYTDLRVVESLRVVSEPTRRAVDGHMVIEFQPHPNEPREVRARLTAPLQTVLQAAARPIAVAALVDDLLAAFPGTARERALSLISAALRNGLLHSDLAPSSLTERPLQHLRAAVARAGAVPPEAPAAMIRDVHSPATVQIPQQLADDVAAALEVMTRCSPNPEGSSAWKAYRGRFFNRYSLGVVVPVLDLVDPARGLGYPAGFLGSPTTGPSRPLTARDAYLLALTQRLNAAGATELQLTDADLSALGPEDPRQVWPTTEVTVAVHAASRSALTTGDYRLTVEGVGLLGTMTGRFLPLMDQSAQAAATAAHQDAPTLDAEAVRVQLCSPPLRWSTQNVTRTIPLVPEVLSLGEFTDRATMWADEIGVTATADRLVLVHMPTGRPIEPFLPNAVNLQGLAHPLARFLVEAPRSHCPVPVPFFWGAAEDLPRLPRVRLGRVILSPARWLVTADDLTTSSTTSSPDPVNGWRSRWKVPAIVSAGRADQRLRLDLDRPAHRDLLARMVASQSTPVRVYEAPDDTMHGWLGYAAQITLAFTAAQPHRPAPHAAFGPVPLDSSLTRWPGTAKTVLARLDTDPDQAPRIFAAGLGELLDSDPAVVRWWFIRYSEQGPHLRIRITLHRPEAFADLAAALARWSAATGLVAGVAWLTDLPETGRYGTGDLLSAAETFFAADSRAALAQAAPGRPEHEREGLLVASLLDITAQLLGGADAALTHWDRPEARGTGFDRAARSVAIRLTSHIAARARTTAVPGTDALTAAWTSRAGALTSYRQALQQAGHDPADVLPTLLHMHHVRAHGPDTAHEEHALRCVRELAHSLLASRAHQAVPA